MQETCQTYSRSYALGACVMAHFLYVNNPEVFIFAAKDSSCSALSWLSRRISYCCNTVKLFYSVIHNAVVGLWISICARNPCLD